MSQSWFLPAGEWGQILGKLAEGLRVSLCWCWHAGGWAGGIGTPLLVLDH